MDLFLLWLGVSIILFIVIISILTIGSRYDDIMLGDDQYKTKEEIDKEINKLIK